MVFIGGTKTHNEPFAYRAEFDSDDYILYEGWAETGTAEATEAWQLCKHTYTNGNLTATKWAQPDASSAGSGEFSFSWTVRTGYTYS